MSDRDLWRGGDEAFGDDDGLTAEQELEQALRERDEALARLKPLKVIHKNEEVPFSNMEEAGAIIAGLLQDRDEARTGAQAVLDAWEDASPALTLRGYPPYERLLTAYLWLVPADPPGTGDTF